MAEIIGIASDHGGKKLKAKVTEFLRQQGFDVLDFGVSVDETQPVDYPDYGASLAKAVSSGKVKRGVAICGSGLGMCVVVNKFPQVRATSVWDEYTARVSRLHNDANVICFGERTINHDRALDFLKIWLETKFEEGRHIQRLAKIKALEKS